MSGLIVVTKFRSATIDFKPRSPIRAPSMDHTVEEVESKYFGVALDVWLEEEYDSIPDVIDGLAPLDRLSEVIAISEHLAHVSRSFILYLSIDGNGRPRLPDEFRFLGYDFGYFLSDYNRYSVLESEIVYGLNEEMLRYAGELNEYFLLNSLSTAERIRILRLSLIDRGVSLENDEQCIPIGIWIYNK